MILTYSSRRTNGIYFQISNRHNYLFSNFVSSKIRMIPITNIMRLCFEFDLGSSFTVTILFAKYYFI